MMVGQLCLLQLLLCWRYQAKIGQDIKVVSQTTKLLLFWLAVPLCPTTNYSLELNQSPKVSYLNRTMLNMHIRSDTKAKKI